MFGACWGRQSSVLTKHSSKKMMARGRATLERGGKLTLDPLVLMMAGNLFQQ